MEDKNCSFRRAICRSPLSFYNQTRRAFSCMSLIFYMCAEAGTFDSMPHMPKPGILNDMVISIFDTIDPIMVALLGNSTPSKFTAGCYEHCFHL